MTFKNDSCHGGKHSKERVTVLLGANASGTEKFKPLVIGKSGKPRCFKQIKTLPVTYRFNKKSWMNADIFSAWLIDLNNKMKKQGRHILILIDNCTANKNIPKLRNVKVIFLPPNTTSALQPLDLGIIKNFKCLYRKEVVRQIIYDIESNKKPGISLLHGVRMIDKAWNNVSEKTIKNCFKKSGVNVSVSESDVEFDAYPKVQWDRIKEYFFKENVEESITFADFVEVDKCVATSGFLQDDDILESIADERLVDDDDADLEEMEDEVNSEHYISSNEARGALNTLRSYLERAEVDDTIFLAFRNLDNTLEIQEVKLMKQKKITDFF